jgi:transcriptional regulator with XRE-family HTH domain
MTGTKKLRTNGTHIRERMEALKISFEKLLTKSGYKEKVLQDALSGLGATPEVLQTLAQVLETTVDDLKELTSRPSATSSRPRRITRIIFTTAIELENYDDASEIDAVVTKLKASFGARHPIIVETVENGSLILTVQMVNSDVWRLLDTFANTDRLERELMVKEIRFPDGHGFPAKVYPYYAVEPDIVTITFISRLLPRYKQSLFYALDARQEYLMSRRRDPNRRPQNEQRD